KPKQSCLARAILADNVSQAGPGREAQRTENVSSVTVRERDVLHRDVRHQGPSSRSYLPVGSQRLAHICPPPEHWFGNQFTSRQHRVATVTACGAGTGRGSTILVDVDGYVEQEVLAADLFCQYSTGAASAAGPNSMNQHGEHRQNDGTAERLAHVALLLSFNTA